MWLICAHICLCLIGIASAEEEYSVDVPLGNIKGLKQTTVLGNKPFFSFKGIPYAKPRIGIHKFDEPVAADPWVGTLDATKHRSTCVFFCMIRQMVVGDEDCLYINVYTPEVSMDAKRAVIVYIHPGGFNGGSGDDDIYGADFLIDQDVIVVTFNFRVGAAGFLSTADENAPGNAGLKDQVLALKWVNENIQSFGGCPHRVTIAGVSSGAASVQFHLLSSMSRGLFRSAIMESGSALNPWAMQYNPKDNAFKLGEVLGIKTTDTKALVDKLKEYTLQDIVAATREVSKTLNFMNGHMAPFVPCVEPDVGQIIFLPNDPWLMIKSDQIADVPIIAGSVLDETGFMAPMFLQNADAMDKNFEMFLPEDLNITDAKKTELARSIRKFYFDDKALTSDSKDAFVKLTSDIYFVAGTAMSTRIIASRIKSPVYEYLFSFYSPIGIMKNLFKIEEGVTHGDDIGYIFYSNVFKNKPDPGSNTEKLVRRVSKLWGNFIKESNPTPVTDDDINQIWTAVNDDGNYLEINEPLKMSKDLFKDRVNFWAQIYADVLSDYIKLFK